MKNSPLKVHMHFTGPQVDIETHLDQDRLRVKDIMHEVGHIVDAETDDITEIQITIQSLQA